MRNRSATNSFAKISSSLSSDRPLGSVVQRTCWMRVSVGLSIRDFRGRRIGSTSASRLVRVFVRQYALSWSATHCRLIHSFAVQRKACSRVCPSKSGAGNLSDVSLGHAIVLLIKLSVRPSHSEMSKGRRFDSGAQFRAPLKLSASTSRTPWLRCQ